MSRTIARVLVVLLAAGGIIAFAFGTRQRPHLSFLDRPAAAPPSASTSSRDATPTTGDLTPTFRAVEAFASAVPKDTFEPEAVLAKTGRDPSAIFAWVRDETVWVPYGGVLRGPTGVLMDRTGNDLDRALLIAQLLKAAGRDVRLARGTLSDAQANDIIDAARPRPRKTPQSASEWSAPVKALLDRYARDRQDEASALGRALQDATRVERDVAHRTVDVATAQSRAIAAKATPAGAKSVDAASVRDHWWTQMRDGANWIDMDPTMADAQSGRALTAAQTTVAPDSVEPSLHHEVEIRVVVERWTAGRLERTPVLTHVVRPSELYGVDVSLLHVPIAWPPDFKAVHEPDPAGRLKTIGLSQHEWLPVLRVGRRLVYQNSFTDAGVKGTARPGAVAAVGTEVKRGVEGVAALFGSPDAQAAPSVMTGEWIEYESRSPNRPARTIRRQLFDAIGPAQRAAGLASPPAMTDRLHRTLALTLLGATDMLVLGAQISGDFASHLVAQRLLANERPLNDVVAARSDAGTVNPGDLTPLPSIPLYTLALTRFAWSRYRDSLYIDRPVILTTHQQLAEGADGSLTAIQAIDIVANEMGVLARANLDPMAVRLEQGVLDTAVEEVIGSGDASLKDRASFVNVSAMLRESRGDASDWLTIRSLDDPALGQIDLGPDARARISQQIAEGYVIVAPKRPIDLGGRPAVGWWRIDPRDGSSLGIDDHGWGTEFVEEAFQLMSVAVCGFNAFRAKDAAKKAEGIVCLFGGGLGYGMRGLAGWGASAAEAEMANNLGKLVLWALAAFQVISAATWG